jgi:hypothetical protein
VTDQTTDVLPYAHFIAGVSLLKTAPSLNKPDRQVLFFRKLQKVTGLQTGEVLTFMTSIRDDPEKGKLLYDSMQKSLEAQSDSIKQ